MTSASITHFLVTTLVAGLLGAAAMEAVMWGIGRAGWAKADMIVAIGSLFTKMRTNAFRVGVVLHAVSAVVFSIAYTLLMLELGLTTLPGSMALGLGVGVVHGMIVSLMLVWVVSEQHPLEEFREADLAIGLSHLAGHVVFGGVIGMVVGLFSL